MPSTPTTRSARPSARCTGRRIGCGSSSNPDSRGISPAHADAARFDAVADRLAGIVFYIASALVDEGVGTIEDTDIGARVGLRWRMGPFELMNRYGLPRASVLIEGVARQWGVAVPGVFSRQAASGTPFIFTLVRRDDSDGIATLTIDRPDALNAINEAVMAQLGAAFRAAAADPSIHGIVLAGSGKAFIAGADIRFFVTNIEAKNIPRIAAFTKTGQELLLEFQRCRKPVVARVQGLALGGGVEIALACHYIVATPKATFAFPETGIGIYPGLGGTQRTTARVGRGLARWLVLSGDTVTADQAVAIGLIDRVVPHEQLDAAIRECVARGPVTSRAPHAVPAAFAAVATRYEADVESLRASEKRVGYKAPLALRAAADLIDRRRGHSDRAGDCAGAVAAGRNLLECGRLRRTVVARPAAARLQRQVTIGRRCRRRPSCHAECRHDGWRRRRGVWLLHLTCQ